MHYIYIALLVVVEIQFSLQNLQNENKNRIYNGNIAKPNSAPYQVALLVYGKYTKLCGGSLIKPKFVLTAGHCLFDKQIIRAKAIQVIVGTNSMNDVKKIKSSPEVVNHKIHEFYKQDTSENDIGIVELRKSVKLSNKIAIINLPIKSDASSLVGKYGRLTGWGRTTENPEKENTILMELKVLLVRNEMCHKYSKYQCDSSKLCACGVKMGSACPGDSGGPLVLENTDIQIGIVSSGSKGCHLGYPHVYINVAFYLDWISKWST